MLHDVTKEMYPGIPVWPGDVEFDRNTVQIGEFSSSSVTMSLHTGTHMDAPRHRFPQGEPINRFQPYIVPAVYRAGMPEEGTAFISDSGLTPEEAESIIQAGAVLVATSSISIDHQGSTSAHEIILGAGIPVIENLDLSGVQAGRYILLAFPLKFRDGDGSPVRVILADSYEDLKFLTGGVRHDL